MAERRMRVGLFVAGLLLLLTVFVGFGLPGLSESSQGPGPDSEMPLVGAPVGRGKHSESSTSTLHDASRERVEPPLREGARIECRVMRGFDGPFPAARVRFELYAGVAAEGEPVFEDSLVADERGLIVTRLPLQDSIARLRIRSDSANSGERAASALIPPDVDRVIQAALYVFPWDRTVEGLVLDADDAPVAGAMVRAFSNEPVRTDEGGRFRLVASTSYPTLRYSVLAEGYGLQRGAIVLGKEDPHRLVVRLEDGYVIEGTVTGASGRPLPGASVSTIHLRISGGGVTTDERGRYRISSAQPGRRRYTLSASAEGYATARRSVDGSSETPVVDFALEPGARMEGRVFSQGGAPVEGASVECAGISAFTEADGTFRLVGLPAGSHALGVDRLGFAPVQHPVDLVAGETLRAVLVTLEAGGRLSGVVTDADGAPLPGVDVWPRIGRGDYVERSATSDARGAFELFDLPEGVGSLDLVRVGYLAIRSAPVRVGQRDARFVMQRSVGFRGRVVAAATGEPVRDFRIRVLMAGAPIDATWVREGYRFQSDTGSWESTRDQLPEGSRWTLEARAPGYAPCVVEGMEVKHDMERTLFEMRPGIDLRGRVLERATGAPVAGIEIELAGSRQLRLERDHQDARLATKTDAEGRFAFADLAPSEYRIVLRRDGRVLQVGARFRPAARSGEQIVWLEALAALEGVVVDEHGSHLSGVDLVLVRETIPGVDREAQQRRTARSGAQGAFRFVDLRSGPHLLTGSHEGEPGRCTVFRKRVRIAGEDTPRLRLEPTGPCRLHLKLQLPPAARNVRVQVVSLGAELRASHGRAHEGELRISGLPSGDCRVGLFFEVAGKPRLYNHPDKVTLEGRGWTELRIDARD